MFFGKSWMADPHTGSRPGSLAHTPQVLLHLHHTKCASTLSYTVMSCLVPYTFFSSIFYVMIWDTKTHKAALGPDRCSPDEQGAVLCFLSWRFDSWWGLCVAISSCHQVNFSVFPCSVHREHFIYDQNVLTFVWNQNDITCASYYCLITTNNVLLLHTATQGKRKLWLKAACLHSKHIFLITNIYCMSI